MLVSWSRPAYNPFYHAADKAHSHSSYGSFAAERGGYGGTAIRSG
jgi:hypothetical protein